ncbi:MAG: HAMP domain-containing protein, partial [Mobilitalea sp.]
MKLTWKIFFSTFILVLLALSLGGTLLLSISFSRSIDGAVEQICKDNRMMMTEIVTLIGNYNKSVYRNEEDALKSILASLSDNWTTDRRDYRIRNEMGTTLQESAGMGIPFNIEQTKMDTVAYQIFKTEEHYYLQAVTRLQLKEQIITIENCNEITYIFKMRKEQQILLIEIVLMVGGLCAVINYIFTIWITKPVMELAKATKEISGGDMGVRVIVNSQDELGTLGNNFNDMADTLEEKIYELKEAARRQEDFVG